MLFHFDHNGREYSLTLVALAVAVFCASVSALGVGLVAIIAPRLPVIAFTVDSLLAQWFVALVFVASFFGVMSYVGVEILIVFHETNDTRIQVLQQQWRVANGYEPQIEITQPPIEQSALTSVYQRDLVVNDRGRTYTVPMDVPLSEREVLWGDALIRALMHAWSIGAVDSGSLSGPGKPINQKGQWKDVTDVLRDMGIVEKNNRGTEILVTYEQAVEMVYPKLRSVTLPARKPPKLPPLPRDMISKWPRLSDKA